MSSTLIAKRELRHIQPYPATILFAWLFEKVKITQNHQSEQKEPRKMGL